MPDSKLIISIDVAEIAACKADGKKLHCCFKGTASPVIFEFQEPQNALDAVASHNNYLKTKAGYLPK